MTLSSLWHCTHCGTSDSNPPPFLSHRTPPWPLPRKVLPAASRVLQQPSTVKVGNLEAGHCRRPCHRDWWHLCCRDSNAQRVGSGKNHLHWRNSSSTRHHSSSARVARRDRHLGWWTGRCPDRQGIHPAWPGRYWRSTLPHDGKVKENSAASRVEYW